MKKFRVSEISIKEMQGAFYAPELIPTGNQTGGTGVSPVPARAFAGGTNLAFGTQPNIYHVPFEMKQIIQITC
jgi:hypothetical protein